MRGEYNKLWTVLIVILIGLIVTSWILMFLGDQSSALFILAIVSAAMIPYWLIYINRNRSDGEKTN